MIESYCRQLKTSGDLQLGFLFKTGSGKCPAKIRSNGVLGAKTLN